jgi:hypothetical protein
MYAVQLFALCTPVPAELRWLSGEDLEWIIGRAICETLGWPKGD